jgi:ADP-ribose pyrophosphatase YjhB (NUDIX family)
VRLVAGSEVAKRETSAGGVVFRHTAECVKFLLIKDPYKKWGLPKGHVDSGESFEAAAGREVTEETGLRDLSLHGSLGTIDWHFRFRGKLIHKFCHFYLFEAPIGLPCPQAEEGIIACCWFPYAEAVKTISYENARHILRQAGEALAGRFEESRPHE